MTAETLLREIVRARSGPIPVGPLRQFVLDLAVSGRLVSQDATDEPARILLDRLKRELLGKATISRSSNSLLLEKTSLPFTAPRSWAWVPLVDLCDVSYGFAFDSARFVRPGSGRPLIRIRDISSIDTQVYFDGPFDSRYLVGPGDYLVGMDGDFNLREWTGPEALLNQRVMRLRQWRQSISPRWTAVPLQMILHHLHASTSQTTVKHLSAKQVNTIQIPLPPLEEQRRIVAKVDEVMALCDLSLIHI